MKTSTTLILALLTALALGYIQFFSSKTAGTAERQSHDRKLLVFEAGEVNRIELVNNEGSFVFTKGDGSGWQIESPVKYPANNQEIEALISELQYQERKSTLDTASLGRIEKSLEQFGLNPPRFQLKIRAGNQVSQLDMGRETVRKGSCYGRVSSGGKVQYIILDQSLETRLLKKTDQWRNPNILDVTSGGITGLVLHQDAREVALEKDASSWKVLKPLSTPADPAQVSSFLSNLLALHADTYPTDNPADHALYGLNSPYLVFDVKLGQEIRSLRVGRMENNGVVSYYGQMSPRPAVFKLEKAAVEMLSGLLEKVRDSRIVRDATAANISGIIFERDKFSIDMTKTAGGKAGWVLTSDMKTSIDSGLVSDLLQRLQNTRAGTFLPSSDDNRKKLDLTKPFARLTLQIQGPDAKVAPKRFLLAFSAGKKGECGVESQFRDDLVTVPADVLTGLPVNLLGWLNRTITVTPEAEITALQWKRGQDSFTISKAGQKDWPSEVQGKKIDPMFLKGQLKLLSGIKTQNWVAETGKDFNQLAATLTVSSTSGQKTLEIGGDPRFNQYMARFAGASQFFLISKSDYLALTMFPLQVATPATNSGVMVPSSPQSPKTDVK